MYAESDARRDGCADARSSGDLWKGRRMTSLWLISTPTFTVSRCEH